MTTPAQQPASAPQVKVRKLRYFVLPKESDLPIIESSQDGSQREKMVEFWTNIGLLHRHEDTLFNSRLQGFLLATSFLVAAFSQFKDGSPAHAWFRGGLCTFGIIFALSMFYILLRTARAIEWYLGALRRVDKVLFSEHLQPYRFRRLRQGTIDENDAVRKPPVMFYLGVFIPTAVTLLWIWLLIWSVAVPKESNLVPLNTTFSTRPGQVTLPNKPDPHSLQKEPTHIGPATK